MAWPALNFNAKIAQQTFLDIFSGLLFKVVWNTKNVRYLTLQWGEFNNSDGIGIPCVSFTAKLYKNHRFNSVEKIYVYIYLIFAEMYCKSKEHGKRLNKQKVIPKGYIKYFFRNNSFFSGSALVVLCNLESCLETQFIYILIKLHISILLTKLWNGTDISYKLSTSFWRKHVIPIWRTQFRHPYNELFEFNILFKYKYVFLCSIFSPLFFIATVKINSCSELIIFT